MFIVLLGEGGGIFIEYRILGKRIGTYLNTKIPARINNIVSNNNIVSTNLSVINIEDNKKVHDSEMSYKQKMP